MLTISHATRLCIGLIFTLSVLQFYLDRSVERDITRLSSFDDEDDTWRPTKMRKKVPKQKKKAGTRQRASFSVSQVSSSSMSSSSSTAAICAIQKGALSYIQEWVDFHLAVGFKTIYIYDNTEDFELQGWWEDFLRKQGQEKENSSVFVYHLPGQGQQLPAYKLCLQQQRVTEGNEGGGETKLYKHDWVMPLDVDEFLVLKKHTNVIEMLQATVPESKSGLVLTREVFYFDLETQLTYKPIPATRRFQTKSNFRNVHAKTISRVADVKRLNVHGSYYHEGETDAVVDTNGNILSWQNRSKFGNAGEKDHEFPPALDIATIFHYQTKSLEEHFSKCDRGNANGLTTTKEYCVPKDKLIKRFSNRAQIYGTVFDDTAWKFLTKAKPEYGRKFNIIEDE